MGSDGGSQGGGKLPIGVNEVLAIGLGAAALLRIRKRRQKEAAEREANERARNADAGNSAKADTSEA